MGGKNSSPSMLRRAILLRIIFAFLIVAPASILVALYRSEDFHPIKLPIDYEDRVTKVPNVRAEILKASEKIGEGRLPGPEDLAFDEASGFLYTSCEDGWIRRVSLGKEKVEDWAYVGGRPLGLALGPDKTLFVATAYKGLMSVGENKEVRLLSEEAEGLRFGLADGIDVAADGVVFFTDASSKNNLSIHMRDILEGRPHGRLLSFDPSTSRTEVLLRGLYFPNGVALSPDQGSLIFCETPLRRCRRYNIRGERGGAVDDFIEALPGFPDNVRYDGDGRFWIALPAGMSKTWELIFRYPTLRKTVLISSKFLDVFHYLLMGSGVLSVSLRGEPLALYKDPKLSLTTVGLKIGKDLYYGSLIKGFLSRISLEEGVTNN